MAEIDKTIIEIFAHKLRMLGEYNSNAEVAPSVILWPDADRRFEQSIDVLQNHIPELFVLASYDSKKRRGPAIWLRCAIAKTVPIESWGNNIPIIYLPGIGRSDFRPDSSDPLLKPLIPFVVNG